ncbi:hypothetical protein G6F37_005508 [Rhizopus arrhizus]|nr:hypothetical protein G6F38_004058 [Rhizopus arrhizus]KAG1158746.1 hypothetical protein G6F37_005508 [Rhizopus arrhizus]
MSEERQHKIAKILEAYFSDANLMWDKFMLSKIKADAEGFVPFETLCKLQKFKALGAKPEEIRECARIHSLSRLKLSVDDKSIARIKPIKSNKDDLLDEWSIYVEGLTKPYQTEGSIAKLFTTHIGNVTRVHIPENRFGKKQFMGFCFIEFDDQEDVNKAAQLISEKRLPNLNLRVMSKIEWNKYKDEYLKRFDERKKMIRELWQEHENKRRQEEAVEQNETKRSKGEKDNTVEYQKGVIVFVDNLHPGCSKTTVAQLLKTSGVSVAYVTPKKRGLPSVHVRLNNSEDAQKLQAYFEEHPTIQETEKDTVGKSSDKHGTDTLKLRILQGTEEKLYWENDTR